MKIERIVKVNRGGARGCVAENRVCQVEYHTKRDSRCLITSGPPPHTLTPSVFDYQETLIKNLRMGLLL